MTNKLNPLHFFNSVNAPDGVLTIAVCDAIGADFFGSGITAAMVADAIKQAGHFESITLSINSPGGDLFEGVAIYNTLKAAGKPVNVEVIGLAASAASLIAMAGDTITMQLGTTMMVHEAMGIAMGYAKDMRKMADTLDVVNDSAVDIYVERTGNSKKRIKELEAAETWMSPKEAVELGFADGVGSAKKASAAATNSFDLSVFRNVPDELKPKRENKPFPNAPAGTPVVTPTEPQPPEPGSPGSPVVNPVVVNEEDPVISILRHRLEMLRA
jgi:ATP-dependent protease ClpP protease subunit